MWLMWCIIFGILFRDLNNVYNCYEDVFKEECPDSPKAWEFEGGLIDALKAGC